MDKSKVLEFFHQWKEFTKDALKVLAPKCSHTTHKTRPFDYGHPVGIIYHYTGGPNGIASHRWGMENPANKETSWHATILDHRRLELDEILDKHPLVKRYLPATALFSGELDKGTHHATWANSRCFGIENENMGLLHYRGVSGNKIYSNGKYIYRKDKLPVLIRGTYWEPYTRAQLICNINIGRALRILYSSEGLSNRFFPTWVLPHSCIDINKTDTGSAFPIHSVRDAVFTDISLNDLIWLRNYGDRLPLTEADVEIQSPSRYAFDSDSNRADDTDEIYTYKKLAKNNKGFSYHQCGENLKSSLMHLGYYIPSWGDAPSFYDFSTQIAVRMFQLSVGLSVDGVVGDKTASAIISRLSDFKFNTSFDVASLRTLR